MNKIVIKGDVEQIIDSNRLYYKVNDGEMIWLVCSTTELKVGWSVKIRGSVSLEIKYKQKGAVDIATLRYVIVDADRVDIISINNEVDCGEIVW